MQLFSYCHCCLPYQSMKVYDKSVESRYCVYLWFSGSRISVQDLIKSVWSLWPLSYVHCSRIICVTLYGSPQRLATSQSHTKYTFIQCYLYSRMVTEHSAVASTVIWCLKPSVIQHSERKQAALMAPVFPCQLQMNASQRRKKQSQLLSELHLCVVFAWICRSTEQLQRVWYVSYAKLNSPRHPKRMSTRLLQCNSR